MDALSILLPIAVTTLAVFQYQYPRTGRWEHHLALVSTACAVDFLLMLAFASSSDYETWAWTAAGSTFIAAIAGNIVLFVGSRHVAVRPGPYYVASTLAVASAVCCATIDKTSEVRAGVDILADYVPFVVTAALLFVAAVAIVLAARLGMQEKMSGKGAYVGFAVLAVAAGLVVAPLIRDIGDGVSGGLWLETPLNYHRQSLSPLVAILTVLGIIFVFHGRRRSGRAVSLGMAILPALLVLIGLDAGVAMALLVGLLLVLERRQGWAKATMPYALIGVVAICTAIIVSPSASAATEYYWTSLADGLRGGSAYEDIRLLATAGTVIDLGGLAPFFSLDSEYGTLSVLGNFLALPTLIALAVMCTSSALGCWAGRKRLGLSGRTLAFPVGATFACIAYVATLTGLGMAPGYAPFPFVNMASEYATAGYALAVVILCLCGCGQPVVANASSAGEPQTAIVPVEAPEVAGWRPFAIVLAFTVACSIGLYFSAGALKEIRDEDALVAYALTYSDDAHSGFLEGNPLAEKAVGDPTAITSALTSPTRADGEDGALLRLVKNYRGGVCIEEGWRFNFPDGIVDINRLSETSCCLAYADVFPAAGYPITDLLDESYFEKALRDALVGYRRDGDLRVCADADEDESVQRALEAIGQSVKLEDFEIQRLGSSLVVAYGTCKANLGESGALNLKFLFSWDGGGIIVRWIDARANAFKGD